MTTRTQHNRLNRLACTADARTHAQHAAIHNEPSNPYPAGSYFAIVWIEAFNATLQRLVNAEAERHEAEFAQRMLAEGQVGLAEELLDAREVQPNWWAGIWNRFFYTGGK